MFLTENVFAQILEGHGMAISLIIEFIALEKKKKSVSLNMQLLTSSVI
jgi:hypothetical protein